jgi:hypothetical protein
VGSVNDDEYCWECGADWQDHGEDGSCPEDGRDLVAHLTTVEDCAVFRRCLIEWAAAVEGKPGFENWPLTVQTLAAAVDAQERSLFEVEP